MIYCEIIMGGNVKMTGSFLEMSLEIPWCSLCSLAYLTITQIWISKAVTPNTYNSHRAFQDTESRHLEQTCLCHHASQIQDSLFCLSYRLFLFQTERNRPPMWFIPGLKLISSLALNAAFEG